MARIAFIDVTATVSYGGLQTVVWKLAEALARAGHEVTIFGGASNVASEQVLNNPLPRAGEGINVHTFPFCPRERIPDLGSRFQRTIERMSFARHARTAVIEGNFDWIIVDKPFDFFWPAIMPSSSKARFAFISGG